MPLGGASVCASGGASGGVSVDNSGVECACIERTRVARALRERETQRVRARETRLCAWGLQCLGVSVPGWLSVREPGCLIDCLASRMGACVRVCAVESKKGTAIGGRNASLAMS